MSSLEVQQYRSATNEETIMFVQTDGHSSRLVIKNYVIYLIVHFPSSFIKKINNKN